MADVGAAVMGMEVGPGVVAAAEAAAEASSLLGRREISYMSVTADPLSVVDDVLLLAHPAHSSMPKVLLRNPGITWARKDSFLWMTSHHGANNIQHTQVGVCV